MRLPPSARSRAAAARPALSCTAPTHQQNDAGACDLPPSAAATVDVLSKWAAADPGWDRLLSSVSLYEIARHAYQQAQHDEAIIALEESLALRLFAYVDQPTLDKWQQVNINGGRACVSVHAAAAADAQRPPAAAAARVSRQLASSTPPPAAVLQP